MDKVRWMMAAMGSVALMATLAPAVPASAESPSHWLSWGRLLTFVRGGTLQDTNRGRDGGSRGSGVCLISPGHGETVWTLEPLFILQGDLKSTALYGLDTEETNDAGVHPGLESDSESADSEVTNNERVIEDPEADQGANHAEPFWSVSLTPDDTFVAIQPYDGDPLQPGTTYEQQIETFTLDGRVVSSRRFSFQIMPEGEERDHIAADLAHLAADLAQSEMDAEAIALAKAEFFFERNLNADALGWLFSVDEPSEDLAETRQTLIKDICSQELPMDE